MACTKRLVAGVVMAFCTMWITLNLVYTAQDLLKGADEDVENDYVVSSIIYML